MISSSLVQGERKRAAAKAPKRKVYTVDVEIDGKRYEFDLEADSQPNEADVMGVVNEYAGKVRKGTSTFASAKAGAGGAPPEKKVAAVKDSIPFLKPQPKPLPRKPNKTASISAPSAPIYEPKKAEIAARKPSTGAVDPNLPLEEIVRRASMEVRRPASSMQEEVKRMTNEQLAKELVAGPNQKTSAKQERYRAVIDEITDRATSAGVAVGELLGGKAGRFAGGHLTGLGAGVVLNPAETGLSLGKMSAGGTPDLRDTLNIAGGAVDAIGYGKALQVAAKAAAKKGTRAIPPKARIPEFDIDNPQPGLDVMPGATFRKATPGREKLTNAQREAMDANGSTGDFMTDAQRTIDQINAQRQAQAGTAKANVTNVTTRPKRPLGELTLDELEKMREDTRAWERGGAGDPKTILGPERYKGWKQAEQNGTEQQFLTPEEYDAIYMQAGPHGYTLDEIDKVIGDAGLLENTMTPREMGFWLRNKLMRPEENSDAILYAVNKINREGWNPEEVINAAEEAFGALNPELADQVSGIFAKIRANAKSAKPTSVLDEVLEPQKVDGGGNVFNNVYKWRDSLWDGLKKGTPFKDEPALYRAMGREEWDAVQTKGQITPRGEDGIYVTRDIDRITASGKGAYGAKNGGVIVQLKDMPTRTLKSRHVNIDEDAIGSYTIDDVDRAWDAETGDLIYERNAQNTSANAPARAVETPETAGAVVEPPAQTGTPTSPTSARQADINADAPKAAASTAPRDAATVRAELEALIAKQRLKSGVKPPNKRRGAAYIPDAEDWANAAKAAKLHIELGARTFAEFSKRMIADLGDWVKPKLRELWEANNFDLEPEGKPIPEKRGPFRTALGVIDTIFSTMREGVATGDISFPTIQGAAALLTDTKAWGKGYKAAFKGYRNLGYEDVVKGIKSDPDFDEIVRTGVHLPAITGEFEEMFQSSALQKVPILGKGVKGAQQSYDASATVTRFMMVKSHLQLAKELNNGKPLGDAAMTQIGDAVNSLTGRASSDFGKGVRTADFGRGIFAPSYWASLYEATYRPFTTAIDVGRETGDWGPAKLYTRKMARLYTMSAALLYSTKLAVEANTEYKVEIYDPRSKLWGKAYKIENGQIVAWDILPPQVGQPVRLITSLLFGRKDLAGDVDTSRWGRAVTVGTTFEGKSAPGLKTIFNMLDSANVTDEAAKKGETPDKGDYQFGKNMDPRQAEGWKNIGISSTPITAQSAKEVYETDAMSPLEKLFAIPFILHSRGPNVYPLSETMKKKLKPKRNKTIDDILGTGKSGRSIDDILGGPKKNRTVEDILRP